MSTSIHHHSLPKQPNNHMQISIIQNWRVTFWGSGGETPLCDSSLPVSLPVKASFSEPVSTHNSSSAQRSEVARWGCMHTSCTQGDMASVPQPHTGGGALDQYSDTQSIGSSVPMCSTPYSPSLLSLRKSIFSKAGVDLQLSLS